MHVLEHPRRPARRAGALEEPLEPRHRARLARALGEHLAVGADRRRGVRAALEERRAAQQERQAARRIVRRLRGLRREDAGELRVRLGRARLAAGAAPRERAVEPRERLGGRRVLGAGRAERLERRVAVAHPLGDLRRAQEVPQPLRALRERGPAAFHLEHLRRALRRLVERGERRERLGVVRRRDEDLLPGLHRGGAPALRAEAGRLAEQGERFGGVGVVRRLLDHLPQLVLAPRLAGEAEQVLLRAVPRRASLGEGAARGDERHVGLVQVLLEDRADLGEQARALARIVHGGEARLAHADAPRVLAEGAQRRVGRLERLPPDGAGERRERRERVARQGPPRIATQDLRVERERAGDVTELRAAQLREPERRLGVEPAREPRLQARREVGRAVEPVVESLERRLRLGVARRERRHVVPGVRRAAGVVEPRLGDDRLLAPRVLARGPLRRPGDGRADVGELSPPLARAVQAAQRGERLAVAGRLLQDARPGLRRAVLVEAAVGELGALAEHRAAVLGGGPLGEVLVDARARLQLLRVGAEPAQLAPHVGVGRARPRRVRGGGEGEGRLAQLLLVDPRDGELRGGPPGRVRARPGLGLERADPAARIRLRRERARGGEHHLRVPGPELLLDRREGARVGGVRGERGREPLHGAAVVAQARLDARRLERGARRLGGVGRHRGELGQRRRAPARVPGRAERVREAGDEARALLRGVLDRGAERGRGARGVVQPVLQHLGALRVQGRALGALRGGRALLEERHGLRPALGGERGPRERGQHRRVAGAELERAPELGRRLVERAEVLLRHRRGADAQRGLVLRPVREAGGGLDEEGHELPVRTDLPRELLAAAAGLGVVGAGAQGGRGGRERAARIAELRGPDLRGVEEVARALPRVGAGRQLARDGLERDGLLVRLAERRVHRREGLGDAEGLDALLEEPLEERRRVPARGGADRGPLQDRERDVGRLGVAPEPVGQHLGASDLERRLLRGPSRVRREPGEHAAALLGRACTRGGLERRVQPPERLLVLGGVPERLAPDAGGLLEPGGVVPEPRELRRERTPLLAGAARAARLELARELLLLARAREARLEGGRGAAVPGVELEQGAPGAHRLLGLAEVAVEDLGDAAQEELARLHVAHAALRGGAIRAGEVEERVRPRRSALHRLADRRARRVERERARERPERLARLPEPLLLHLGEPLEVPHPLAGLARPLRGELEHLREPRPLARLGEERRERGGGLRVAGVGAERRLEVAAGAGGIGEPVARELRGADAERRVRRLLGGGGEVPLQGREGGVEPPGVDVVLERLERRALAGGVEVEGALERRERALDVAEAHEVDARHLEVELDERGPVARDRGEPGERVRVGAVVAPLRVHPADELERERVARGERPGALDPLGRPRSSPRGRTRRGAGRAGGGASPPRGGPGRAAPPRRGGAPRRARCGGTT